MTLLKGGGEGDAHWALSNHKYFPVSMNLLVSGTDFTSRTVSQVMGKILNAATFLTLSFPYPKWS